MSKHFWLLIQTGCEVHALIIHSSNKHAPVISMRLCSSGMLLL